MMLPAAIETALIDIAKRLDDHDIDFCVGGSVMLALNGFEVAVGDIDIVVAAPARAAVDEIFVEQTQRTRTEFWRSDWAVGCAWFTPAGDVGVDIIGDMRVAIDGGIARFPIMVERWSALGDIDVPVAPLRHWYHVYRVHNPAKATLIAGRLTDQEIIIGAGELGIGGLFSPTLIVRIGNESQPQGIEQNMSNEHQSSIIEVASPTDHKFDDPESSDIDMDLLNETLEYIRPALQADGGDLVLLGTEGGKVTLQMVGACGGCPLSTMTLTAGIERIVQDRVPGVTEVVSV
jgi:Fe-S cluster biogenesis protein NfuA